MKLLSWRIWAALAAAGLLALGLYQLRAQAEEIGALQAENATQRQAIDQLGHALTAQHEHHARQLAARDAALDAERAHAAEARQRADSLSHEIRHARATDADIDACMGLQLPAGIADSLRQ
ncbi:DUF2570 domain-containing protein [Billgrantia pellis]|uniref:DUF2570 domain-containing protein n=1 Tax=Billgrantia pellis TaxID=2606936 RepID=A0A7V7KJT0_9GAMM|nr:DUF2570 family protein [Halomonas pellis]KAA0014418.1 DUF2570 domain-containing protein [Halomonas pellis]